MSNNKEMDKQTDNKLLMQLKTKGEVPIGLFPDFKVSVFGAK